MWETLSPPLLENGFTYCDEIGSQAAYSICLSDGETISDPPTTVFPEYTIGTDRQTDRPVAIPTHWLTSHESAKILVTIGILL